MCSSSVLEMELETVLLGGTRRAGEKPQRLRPQV